MSDLLTWQAELRDRYRTSPEAARIVKRVRSGPADGRDPFHGTVAPENLANPDAPYGVVWRYGIDRAVGGLHDAPNPGELLCGELDVRGTLALDRAVPVGFERLVAAIRVRAAPGTSRTRL